MCSYLSSLDPFTELWTSTRRSTPPEFSSWLYSLSLRAAYWSHLSLSESLASASSPLPTHLFLTIGALSPALATQLWCSASRSTCSALLFQHLSCQTLQWAPASRSWVFQCGPPCRQYGSQSGHSLKFFLWLYLPSDELTCCTFHAIYSQKLIQE